MVFVLVGLENTGNLCYLNSAVQFLLSNVLFRNFVINHHNHTNEILQQLLLYLQQTPGTSHSLKDLQQILAKKWPIYAENEQMDAQEVMLRILEDIESDPISKPLIQEMFDYNNVSIVTCCLCGRYKNKNKQPIRCLSISPSQDMRRCLKRRVEKMDELRCGCCEEIGGCSKTEFFVKPLPRIMMVQINRYDPNAVIENLMTSFTYHENTYALTSAVVHYGDTHGGHYESFVCIKNQWISMNDTKIKTIERTEALQNIKNFGYLLSYSSPIL